MNSINNPVSFAKDNLFTDFNTKSAKKPDDEKKEVQAKDNKESSVSVNQMAHVLNNLNKRIEADKGTDNINLEQKLDAVQSKKNEEMMSAQSSSITPEFVASLLERNPYEGNN